MSGSSAKPSSAFDNVRWAHVNALLDVLRDSEIADDWYVERRYREAASGYTETRAFLSAIGLLEHAAGKVVGRNAVGPEEDRRRDILTSLIEVESAYRDELFRFLRAFRIIEGQAIRRADVSERVLESACRNLLMDLGVVRYRSDTDDYVVEPAHIWIYAAARESKSGLTARRMRAFRDERTAIGDAAEIAVVAWERQRLGPKYADRVKHIAPQNAAAGYDVLSATVTASQIHPRYIEVKAVSRHSFQFFWSENEVNVASVLNEMYYLYLVPVDSAGEPVVNDARMICNPYVAVLRGTDWEVEANVRSCRPAGGLG
jgi:hypothetical protein